MDDIRPVTLPPTTPLMHRRLPNYVMVLALVLGLALVVGLGYWAWFQNNLPSTDTADIILKKPIKAATDLAPKSLAYVNNVYGFTVNFNSVWTGYKVKTVVPTDGTATAYLYVNAPTTSATFAQETISSFAGYVSVMAIGVYTSDQWNAVVGTPAQGNKLAQNSHYVFDYSQAQDYPQDDAAVKNAVEDIPTVIATFKLN